MLLAPASGLLLCWLGVLQWPQFRGPAGSGVSDASALPARLELETNLLWRTPVEAGHASPVVFGARVFLTGRSGTQLITVCRDLEKGARLWSAALEPPEVERHH